jgi:predicted HicB family RNase H-like nuclease
VRGLTIYTSIRGGLEGVDELYKEEEIEPRRNFSGKFNLRITPSILNTSNK